MKGTHVLKAIIAVKKDGSKDLAFKADSVVEYLTKCFEENKELSKDELLSFIIFNLDSVIDRTEKHFK